MRLTLFLAATIAPVVLGACSEPGADAAADDALLSRATPAGDADAAGEMAEMLNLAVQELTPADIRQADLEGELGCAFTPSLRGETLFLAGADVIDDAGGEGLIRLPDGVKVLQMEGTGGFEAMSRGARFTGEDVRVAIAITGEDSLPEDPPVAAESPAFPATMTLSNAANEITIRGVYECGP